MERELKVMADPNVLPLGANPMVEEVPDYEFEAWNTEQSTDMQPGALVIKNTTELKPVVVQPDATDTDADQKLGWKDRAKSGVAKLAIVTLGATLVGNAVANADDTERANGSDASASAAKSGEPAPATYNYTNKAVRPLAGGVIKAFRRAKPSDRSIERHTSGVTADGNNLTKLDVILGARVKGDNSSRGLAYYSLQAWFKGAVKPKNVAEVAISKATIASKYQDRGFTLYASKTQHPGPSGIVTPWLWSVSPWVGGRDDDRYDSCSIKGSEGYWPTLSKPIIDASIGEAKQVIKDARYRRPLKKQRNVLAGMKSAKGC